jgi:hypothetical protein
MHRYMFLVIAAILTVPASSRGDLYGSWVKTGTHTTNPLIYFGLFDTWEFQVKSVGTPAINVDAMSLNFTSASGAMLTDGGTTFKQGSANPVVFGFEAPDCFFVLPNGATQLAATQVDNANILQSDYTTQGAVILVPNTGVPTTVAAFSVPTGTTFGGGQFPGGVYFAGGAAVSQGDPPEPIIFQVPEPATLALLAPALLAAFARRCRRS